MDKQKITQKKIDTFQKKILDYYSKNKRDLPWRKTHNPYHILLSEFMLQQTQVNRVIEYYNKWIKKWPTIEDLSKATLHEVISNWMGLGYNRRAKYLHETAQIIVRDFKSDVLTAMESYKKLPGIGNYTSKAVRIFSGNEDITTIDTNIRRIYIHEFELEETISENDLYNISIQCLPKGNSRLWHNALMDYGAMVLTSQKTGIRPKTKQSKFEGSDRQIRGKILRFLLEKPANFTDINDEIKENSVRLKHILDKMAHEKIIKYKNNKYFVKKN